MPKRKWNLETSLNLKILKNKKEKTLMEPSLDDLRIPKDVERIVSTEIAKNNGNSITQLIILRVLIMEVMYRESRV